MTDVTLLGCRLDQQADLFDIRVADGRIAAIEPAGTIAAAGATHVLAGRLMLPAFCDGHIHLDKTFTGAAWRPHVDGVGIAARIAAEQRERAAVPLSVDARARRLAERAIGHGVLAMRSHVDVDAVVKLKHVEVLLALREELRERIDIQLVAFPQGGLRDPQVARLLEDALRLGVDVIGGLDPAGIDGDIERHLDPIFDLAHRYGSRIDIHLHDPGTLGAFELRRIADRAAEAGMQGRVAVSHAFALGMIDADELALTADALAAAGVSIMTNGPGADAMPPLRALRGAGVTMFGGSDNIRDAWSPFGDGDMLRRAGIIGYRADYRRDDDLRHAFAMVTGEARRATGHTAVDVVRGSPADLVAVAASIVPEAVADPPVERLVFRAGRLVAGALSGQPI